MATFCGKTSETAGNSNLFNGWTISSQAGQIECPEGCIVVQCGNMLEYLTGGEFLSAEHEIRFQIGVDPRLSIAYFIHVLLDTMLEPLPQFRSKMTAKQYPRITAHDFLNKRLQDANLKQY